MSIPFSSPVPISAVVSKPAFTIEKLHGLLAMQTEFISPEEKYVEFSGPTAVLDFKQKVGENVKELKFVENYFNFLSKTGRAPEKLVVARWFRANTSATAIGKPVTAKPAEFTNIAFSFVNASGETKEITTSLSSEESYSAIAEKITTALNPDATCEYSSVSKGFIIKSAATGAATSFSIAIAEGPEGDEARLAGLENGTYTGVNKESYKDLLDRVYNANSAGYAVTTLEAFDTKEEILEACAWLQGSVAGQTRYTAYKLVFDYTDKAFLKEVQEEVVAKKYTGVVAIYDPYVEYPNALDLAIGASVDFSVPNSALNFNFQKAIGYTPITSLGSVVDYQMGLTNVGVMEELNKVKASAIYSIGVGTQEEVIYGIGRMAGAFTTEDIQLNESALERDMQTSIVNVLISLDKMKLHGEDADGAVMTILNPIFEKFKTAGAIARNATLLNNDKIVLSQTFGPDAIGTVERNGYVIKVLPRNEEDNAKQRIRVITAYVVGGVVNEVRIINNIYGA